MAATSSPFCEHKKLRTSCGLCKSTTLVVDPTLQAVPFLSADERERLAAKREKRAGGSGSSRTARETSDDQPGAPGVPSHTDVVSKAVRPSGPGKPLLPQRKRANRNITPAEADAVKPWWVKK
jgi:hypothetical protein